MKDTEQLVYENTEKQAGPKGFEPLTFGLRVRRYA